jgi:hypothetical protein
MASIEGKVLLFGGWAGGLGFGNVQLLDDTWEWDGTEWSNLMVSGPTARMQAAMATMGHDLVLFGGDQLQVVQGEANLAGDTWD